MIPWIKKYSRTNSKKSINFLKWFQYPWNHAWNTIEFSVSFSIFHSILMPDGCFSTPLVLFIIFFSTTPPPSSRNFKLQFSIIFSMHKLNCVPNLVADRFWMGFYTASKTDNFCEVSKNGRHIDRIFSQWREMGEGRIRCGVVERRNRFMLGFWIRILEYSRFFTIFWMQNLFEWAWKWKMNFPKNIFAKRSVNFFH